MLEIFYAPTPNGWKISILLEELVEAGKMKRDEFEIVPVNLATGEQFTPEFLAVSPNGRMPALRDGKKTVFESGAVLIYIANKYGMFFPTDAKDEEHYDVLQWLFWQVGGLGPMAGQVSHFVNYAPHISPNTDHSYSLERYKREYNRLLSVMDKQLEKTRYLSGDSYTIADMASFPWVIPYQRFGADIAKFPNLKKWYDELKVRPGVRRGVETLKAGSKPLKPNEETAKTLFQRSKM